jgi:hypothetical protein
VAISGQTAIVGVCGDNTKGPRSGAAYVFRCDGSGQWRQEAKLTAADAAASSSLGWSLALSGVTAVIGAYEDSSVQAYAGAAYVFQRTDEGAWRQIAKLAAEDAAKCDHFWLVDCAQWKDNRRWRSAAPQLCRCSLSF